MPRITEQDLGKIQFLFTQFKLKFEIYDNHETYSQNYRDKAHEEAMNYAERLKKFGLYYVIYDEDNECSFIRPDCYSDEYNHKFQTAVERRLNINYDTGEE